MADHEGFPVLNSGGVVKAFPDLRVGDLIKINLSEFDTEGSVGEYLLMRRDEGSATGCSFEVAAEGEVLGSAPGEVGALLTDLDDSAATLEIRSSADEEPRT